MWQNFVVCASFVFLKMCTLAEGRRLWCSGRQCVRRILRSFPGKQCGPVSTDIGWETAQLALCSLEHKYLNTCTSSADGNGWTEERRNAELLNILTIGRQGENILTREEEVVNDLCKVWVLNHIC